MSGKYTEYQALKVWGSSNLILSLIALIIYLPNVSHSVGKNVHSAVIGCSI